MSETDPTPPEDLALDSDPVLELLLDEGPPPVDPFPARFAAILLAGVVLIGMAAAGRVALEQAAPPPPGVTEPSSPYERDVALGDHSSVARYEYERARALR